MDADDYARILLEYMRLDMQVRKCDVIIGLGSAETRVAERSATLMLEGYGDVLVFAGGYGKLTALTNDISEAETFKRIAIKMGVDEQRILLETDSTNTGDNIINAQNLLADRGIRPQSMLIVTKPAMERRVYATFQKKWQAPKIDVIVTSPQLTYEELFEGNVPKQDVISVIVGDVQRIREYPKLGFLTKQHIPENVWRAYESLVAMGYTKYLLK